MAMRCKVCESDALPTINRIIAEGKTANRKIAVDYELSESSVWRHAKDHVPALLQAAIQRREATQVKQAVAATDRVTEQQTAVADEFLEDIQYSKRYAKLGVERCMATSTDPETGEAKPAPVEEFRLAPGFLASLDRANTLLGQATGRLNAAPTSVTHNHLSVIMPRAVEQQPTLRDKVDLQLTDCIDVNAIEPQAGDSSVPAIEPGEPPAEVSQSDSDTDV